MLQAEQVVLLMEHLCFSLQGPSSSTTGRRVYPVNNAFSTKKKTDQNTLDFRENKFPGNCVKVWTSSNNKQ